MEPPFSLGRASSTRQDEVRNRYSSRAEYQRRRSSETPRHSDQSRQIPPFRIESKLTLRLSDFVILRAPTGGQGLQDEIESAISPPSTMYSETGPSTSLAGSG